MILKRIFASKNVRQDAIRPLARVHFFEALNRQMSQEDGDKTFPADRTPWGDKKRISAMEQLSVNVAPPK